MSVKVAIAAAEPSGDEMGAALIRALRLQHPDIEIMGIGRSAMAAEGVSSDIDMSPLSVLGFAEGLRAYPIVLDRVRRSAEYIMAQNPQAVVLIDSWGFMMRLAQALGRLGYEGKIIKYVAPQVFATREGRAKILAEGVDHLMTIHNFDAPYFERHGLPVTYVGNPVFDKDYSVGGGKALREMYNIPKDAPVIAVMFGSRLSEIQRLAEPFASAVARVKKARPDAHFISAMSDNIAEDILAAAAIDPRLQDVILLPEDEKLAVFSAADMALACSGTVTSQLATLGMPTIVAYRLSPLTYFFGKYMFKGKYITLLNISADKALMPEFVQHDCTGQNLADSLLGYLNDPAAVKASSAAIKKQAAIMKGKGGAASERAAKTVLGLIGSA